MDIKKFSDRAGALDIMKWGQQPEEYKTFFEFTSSYFRSRGIVTPVVVEIGIWNDYQRWFYEELMKAFYVSIDISDIASEPTILGDSLLESTYQELLKQLGGRVIDLLFIDGNHTYEGVKHDYIKYGSLVKHIIVVHDINSPLVETDMEPIDVTRFWKELKENNKEDTLMEISHFNSVQFYGRQMGIGVVVKGG